VVDTADCQVMFCLFLDIASNANGGAIYLNTATLTGFWLRNCTFHRCGASGASGGCCFINSNGFTIGYCCFRDCYAQNGQVLSLEGSNAADLDECSSYGCSPSSSPAAGYGAFYFNTSARLNVLHSNFSSCCVSLENGDGSASIVRGTRLPDEQRHFRFCTFHNNSGRTMLWSMLWLGVTSCNLVENAAIEVVWSSDESITFVQCFVKGNYAIPGGPYEGHPDVVFYAYAYESAIISLENSFFDDTRSSIVTNGVTDATGNSFEVLNLRTTNLEHINTIVCFAKIIPSDQFTQSIPFSTSAMFLRSLDIMLFSKGTISSYVLVSLTISETSLSLISKDLFLSIALQNSEEFSASFFVITGSSTPSNIGRSDTISVVLLTSIIGSIVILIALLLLMLFFRHRSRISTNESTGEETHTDSITQTLLTDADTVPWTELFVTSGGLGVREQPKPLF
jgi:hypothetical protein